MLKIEKESLEKLVGKTIADISTDVQSDEGFAIIFTDGTILTVGWSSCEGDFTIEK